VYCPVCRKEYREGYYQCSDCEVSLVHELPNEPESVEEESVSDDFVEVFSTLMHSDLSIIKSILDAERIPYFFQGEFSHEMDAGNPMRLLVRVDQAEEVQEILHEIGLIS